MTEETDLAEQAASADPAVGLRGVRALRQLADRLEARHVQRARAAGWSWQEIAIELGVTRQAVHQKHGSRLSGRLATRGGRG